MKKSKEIENGILVFHIRRIGILGIKRNLRLEKKKKQNKCSKILYIKHMFVYNGEK